MGYKLLRSFAFAVALLITALSLPQTSLAGPPLICHPIEIGDARSLPWESAAEWRAVKRDYDLNRLVEDTLALLTPETPVLVRMETLRRATVYAVWAQRDHEVGLTVKNSKVAEELLSRLMARVRASVRPNQPPTLELFDAGYLNACYEQAGYNSARKSGNALDGYTMVKKSLDGYTMVRKASGMSGQNVEMEFAAALISKDPKRPAYREHLQRAVAGAKEGTLLARNLVKHFGQSGQNLSDLRAQVSSARN
jgi:hypothetical protein